MAEDTLLNEAIEALRKNDKARAKDLLTRLLKVDQKNANYWVWLSAAVDTDKERIFCLQTAYKLDPANEAARRGLVIFGALKQDRPVQRFNPELFNQPVKGWEISEPESPGDATGIKVLLKKPVIKYGLLVSMLMILVLVVWAGYNKPKAVPLPPTRTPGPSPTFTLTPTSLNANPIGITTPIHSGPTALWMLLSETYTPTPLYVITEHPFSSRDAFNAGILYFQQGNWLDSINLMRQVISLEPGSAADAWYYIGEAYRLDGKLTESKNAFTKAIQVDPNFGAAYLGRAVVSRLISPDVVVLPDLNRSAELDPGHVAVYVERASYYLYKKDTSSAQKDIDTALGLDARSPAAYLMQARLYLTLHDPISSLEAALKANQLDVTDLPSYLILGQAYIGNGDFENAVTAIKVYNAFLPKDQAGQIWLAAAYIGVGDYQDAITLLDGVLAKDKRQSEAYYQRGMGYLGLEKYDKAIYDLQSALNYDPKDFDAYIGLARVYLGKGLPGEAYLQIKNHAAALAAYDSQKAQVYYWEATALEALDNQAAVVWWQALLDLPVEAVPGDWQDQARAHLDIQLTGTPVSTQSTTPGPTGKTTITPTGTP